MITVMIPSVNTFGTGSRRFRLLDDVVLDTTNGSLTSSEELREGCFEPY
jgi:hypothetical protein